MTAITMERIRPAPAPPALNPAQRAFLSLHLHPVECHQWHFVGTQLRAQAEGISCTIWRDDLEHLIRLGLLVRGLGCADVAITEQGREAIQ